MDFEFDTLIFIRNNLAAAKQQYKAALEESKDEKEVDKLRKILYHWIDISNVVTSLISSKGEIKND